MEHEPLGTFRAVLDVPTALAIEAVKTRFDFPEAPNWPLGTPSARLQLDGRNPIGTAPVWGLVAIDPIWPSQADLSGDPLTEERTIGPDTSRTVVEIRAYFDPRLKPRWSTADQQRHLDDLARTIGERIQLRIIEASQRRGPEQQLG